MWEWDEAKRAANLEKHGLDFARVHDLDWRGGVTREDVRLAYGERPSITTAKPDGRLHVCVWPYQDGRPRVISLRKANPREGRQHDREKLH